MYAALRHCGADGLVVVNREGEPESHFLWSLLAAGRSFVSPDESDVIFELVVARGEARVILFVALEVVHGERLCE